MSALCIFIKRDYAFTQLLGTFASRSTFSAVRAVFGFPLPVLHFVVDPRTSVRLHNTYPFYGAQLPVFFQEIWQ